MKRLAVTLSMLALLACGGTETAQTTSSEAMPPVSAQGEAAPAPELPERTAAPAPEVASCLNLIRQQRFQEALPTCLAALELDPDNPEVKAAVDQARSEAAKLAAAKAGESAPSEAAAQLDEAAKALPRQPGE